jgi:SAM-dependent methyltransferase
MTMTPPGSPAETPDNLARHWNGVFSKSADRELGWYEESPAQTLRMLQCARCPGQATIFLPGAGTSVLVDELLARGHRLVLNDISATALDKLRGRLRERPGVMERVRWLRHDISRPLPPDVPPCDLWIDRAVLHFLTDEARIAGYFENLRRVVRPGGQVLLAEFSYEAPPRCAGLEVHRYTLEEMVERMGEDFEMVAFEHYTYVNPRGEPRPYLYALFRRAGEERA